jgi:hypothetical protein
MTELILKPPTRMKANLDRGYASPGYAHSLSEFGEPTFLQPAGGWYLKRPIPDTDFYDGMGIYPLLSCQDPEHLSEAIVNEPDLVSFVGVTDPMMDWHPSGELNPGAIPFKQHYIVDFERPLGIDSHHRRNAKQALKTIQVERVGNVATYLETWISLYQQLIERHHIQGIARFSEQSFASLFAIPELIIYRAIQHNQTVGMVIWMTRGSDSYYHLAAYSEEGYVAKASFALFWTAIEDQKLEMNRMVLGAGAGLQNQQDGLTRFKSGWANDTRTNYLIRHILQPNVYDSLTNQASHFFPAYRSPGVKG